MTFPLTLAGESITLVARQGHLPSEDDHIYLYMKAIVLRMIEKAML